MSAVSQTAHVDPKPEILILNMLEPHSDFRERNMIDSLTAALTPFAAVNEFTEPEEVENRIRDHNAKVKAVILLEWDIVDAICGQLRQTLTDYARNGGVTVICFGQGDDGVGGFSQDDIFKELGLEWTSRPRYGSKMCFTSDQAVFTEPCLLSPTLQLNSGWIVENVSPSQAWYKCPDDDGVSCSFFSPLNTDG